MGRMTLFVSAKIDPVISVNVNTKNTCNEEYSITINVPSGSRHVRIIASGNGASPNINEVISSDKTYVILLDGAKSTQAINNIETSSINITIRETSSSGAVLERRAFIRTHTGNFC